MAEWTFTCWSCRETTEMDDKVTRSDECPHCRNDMRSCKNCQYYDSGSHNECTETISEYVPNKERSPPGGLDGGLRGGAARPDPAQPGRAHLRQAARRPRAARQAPLPPRLVGTSSWCLSARRPPRPARRSGCAQPRGAARTLTPPPSAGRRCAATRRPSIRGGFAATGMVLFS